MTPSDSPRRVLISAGAAGIGRRIAESFLAGGAAVHVCDVSPHNISTFLAANPQATASEADVSQPDQVERVFADLADHYKALDVLVNSAGIAGPIAPVEDVAVEDWDRCIAIDLNGVFYMTRHAVPLLRSAGGGSIINIASTAGLFGCPSRAPYASAKWGVIGLTKTLAMELGEAGIRVNAICPGSVGGPRIEAVIAEDATRHGVPEARVRDAYLGQTSLRRFIDADEVAATALFLASDAGAGISGQAIAVDGNTESLVNRLE